MLSVKDLSFDYGEQPLLANINLRLEPGQLLHLRGANGAGKTSLLKLIAGILLPDSGEIAYQEQVIHCHLSAYQQAITYVGHKPGLSALLSLRENYQFDDSISSASLETALQAFDLLAFSFLPCAQLSMGQRRKGSLLRLMMRKTPLWLLDEPFIGLDQQAVQIFMQKLASHLHENGSVIITSHQDFPKMDLTVREYFL